MPVDYLPTSEIMANIRRLETQTGQELETLLGEADYK